MTDNAKLVSKMVKIRKGGTIPSVKKELFNGGVNNYLTHEEMEHLLQAIPNTISGATSKTLRSPLKENGEEYHTRITTVNSPLGTNRQTLIEKAIESGGFPIY